MLKLLFFLMQNHIVTAKLFHSLCEKLLKILNLHKYLFTPTYLVFQLNKSIILVFEVHYLLHFFLHYLYYKNSMEHTN